MKLEEYLKSQMGSVTKQYDQIEAIADKTLVERLGFIGANTVNRVYEHDHRHLSVTYKAGHEINRSDGGGPGLRIYFVVSDGDAVLVKVMAFIRFKPSFSLSDIRVLETSVDNPDYADMLPGQIRGCEKRESQVNQTEKDHRDLAASRAVGEFVKSVSLLLCKQHFRG
ncbi:hypothetical protein [Marinobacter alkaliphilus]|uniref:Uncharacterized protein n=1 Tax=Marinobacter alkaliphilus TaxID=254719 RepID=A0ABZ3EB18_9GAMM